MWISSSSENGDVAATYKEKGKKERERNRLGYQSTMGIEPEQ